MKTPLLRVMILTTSCIVTLAAAAFAGADTQTAKEPAPAGKQPPETKPNGNDLLKAAVTVMSGLSGYHAGGTFTAGEAKATISGDFGVGVVDMQVLGFDGKITFRRAVKDKFYISHDSGKSWQEDPMKDLTSLLSLAVTSPLNTANKLWEQGEFKVLSAGKLDGEEVLHLQKPATESEPGMDFWIARDATLGLVIRKASFVVSGSDGDFPVVLAYTALNEPVKITAPATAPAKDGKTK